MTNKDPFDLEEILREFGSGDQPAPEEPETPEAQPVPEPVEEAQDTSDEDVKIFRQEELDKPAQADLEQTQRFTPVGKENGWAMEGQTIRLDREDLAELEQHRPEVSNEETRRMEPITEEQIAAFEAESQTQEPEPFSQNWEPEYEQPMGEYIPPEPIVFRPRSRLAELKKKLVAGPERRYYALVEEGLGKYQISIFLSCLVVILAVGGVVLYELGMVQPQRMRLLVFGELFAVLLSALLGSERLLEGFVSLFRGKFNLDSLMTMTFLVCVVDGIFCLQEVRVPYCAPFCLEMTMSIWAEYQRRNTELGQMDTMRRATRLNRVAKAPDCREGRPGFFVEDGEVEDFMDSYQAPSGPEKAMNRYALAALVLSGVVGLMAGLGGGVADGFRIWSAGILAAVPATAFVCQTRPMALLGRRFQKLGVVLCGWQGVKAACGKSVVPLGDEDLLPGGSVKVNGVKFYSQRNPDQTVEYATALMEESGMGIAPLFTQLLESRYGRHFPVKGFRYYENGGIGGQVCGEPVLVGCMTFLQEMGVDLPEGAQVSQAVYVAVDGELCGVFAMAFGKLKGVGAGLGSLCGTRGLTTVLTTGNFLLNESFIRGKFGVNTRRIAFPTMEERSQLAQWQPDPEQAVCCALTTQEGLTPTAFAITGARALRSAVNAGTWMHIVAGLIGMAVVLVLTLVEGGALLSAVNLLLLDLIWAVPGLLITQWTRRL